MPKKMREIGGHFLQRMVRIKRVLVWGSGVYTTFSVPLHQVFTALGYLLLTRFE